MTDTTDKPDLVALAADYRRYVDLVNRNHNAITDTVEAPGIAEADYAAGVAYLKREHAAFPELLRYAMALERAQRPRTYYDVDEAVRVRLEAALDVLRDFVSEPGWVDFSSTACGYCDASLLREANESHKPDCPVPRGQRLLGMDEAD